MCVCGQIPDGPYPSQHNSILVNEENILSAASSLSLKREEEAF